MISSRPSAGSDSPGTAGVALEAFDKGGVVVATLNSSAARVVIGRSPDAGFRLNHDTVSRHHAELVNDPFGRWWVRDLASRNKTRLNGRVVTDAMLRSQDRLRIGNFDVLVRLSSAVEATTSFSGVGQCDPSDEAVSVADDPTALGLITLGAERSPAISTAHVLSLGELGRQLNDVEDLNERATILCTRMIDADFRGRSAMILRLSAGEQGAPGGPVVKRVCEAHSPHAEQSAYVSRSLLDRTFQSKEPAMATNAHRGGMQSIDMSLSPDVMRIAAMACPLGESDTGLDVLYIELPAECGSAEWLAMGSLAARQFQQSESLWGTRNALKSQAIIEHDLKKAREIQHRLLPRVTALPGVELGINFQPCQWVGGDYVDAIAMPDGRVLLAIADVCGKGTQAALMASSVHTLVRAGVRAGAGVGDLMRGIDEHLTMFLPDYSFVTMIAMAVDPKTGVVEYVNAGHPPPVIVDSDGTTREMALAGSPPLGAGLGPFESSVDQLPAGRWVAMYTDGWTELRSGGNQMLGPERLFEAVAAVIRTAAGATAQQLTDRIAAELDKFRDLSLAGDDRTLVLFATGPG